MGFSPVGTTLVALLLAPSLVLAARPARGVPEPAPCPSWLVWLERVGQVACVALLTFTGAGRFASAGLVWIAPIAAIVAANLGLWVRYARSGSYRMLFAPWGPVPVPLAVLPAAAFALSAAATWSAPLAGASAVFAVGHIGVSLSTWRRLREPSVPLAT